jgi:type I restriction enzyme S subunit
MKRRRAALGNLCTLIKGTSPISKTPVGLYPLVTTGKEHKTSDTFQFDEEAVCIPLISSTGHGHASLKRVHYQTGKFALANLLVAALIKDNSFLSAKYLARYLMFTKDRLIVPLMTGAANMSISIDRLATVPIEFPPLAVQERIVQLLDEADQVRHLRVKADRRTSDLIPALFYEMFGDPLVNTKKWPMCLLKELAEKFSDGPFGSNLKSEHYIETGVRVLRLQNVGVGVFIDEDKAYISDRHFRSLIKHQCLPGDVIVGTLGAPNLRACTLPDYIPQALNKADCVQIRPRRALATSEYICWLLNMPATLQMASGLVMGQTRSRISMGRLSTLPVPIPPLALQQSFSAQVAEVHDIKEKQAVSRKSHDALFQSLIHGAFHGEL